MTLVRLNDGSTAGAAKGLPKTAMVVLGIVIERVSMYDDDGCIEDPRPCSCTLVGAS